MGTEDVDLGTDVSVALWGSSSLSLKWAPLPISFTVIDCLIWGRRCPWCWGDSGGSRLGWVLPYWRGEDNKMSQWGERTEQVPIPWRPTRGIVQTLGSETDLSPLK